MKLLRGQIKPLNWSGCSSVYQRYRQSNNNFSQLTSWNSLVSKDEWFVTYELTQIIIDPPFYFRNTYFKWYLIYYLLFCCCFCFFGFNSGSTAMNVGPHKLLLEASKCLDLAENGNYSWSNLTKIWDTTFFWPLCDNRWWNYPHK